MALIKVVQEVFLHDKIGVGSCRTPNFGGKNDVFGGPLAAILKLLEGLLHSPARWSVSRRYSEGYVRGSVISEPKMTNAISMFFPSPWLYPRDFM